jgi:hypothetical protein
VGTDVIPSLGYIVEEGAWWKKIKNH